MVHHINCTVISYDQSANALKCLRYAILYVQHLPFTTISSFDASPVTLALKMAKLFVFSKRQSQRGCSLILWNTLTMYLGVLFLGAGILYQLCGCSEVMFTRKRFYTKQSKMQKHVAIFATVYMEMGVSV